MGILPTNLKEITRTRVDSVWQKGSPLKYHYKTISCEQCKLPQQQAIVVSVGWSWRSGCDDCNCRLNYWDETDEQIKISFDRYSIRVNV